MKKTKKIIAVLLAALLLSQAFASATFAARSRGFELTEIESVETVKTRTSIFQKLTWNLLWRPLSKLLTKEYKKNQDGVSLQAAAIEKLFGIIDIRKFDNTDEVIDTIDSVAKTDTTKVSRVSAFLFGADIYSYSYEFENGKEQSIQLAVFNGRSRYSSDDKVVLYFHGGAYLNAASFIHYWYCERLAEELDCTVIMPMILYAPNYTYEESYELSLGLYKAMLEKFSASNISFMGDSSGGSYATALALVCQDNGVAQPSNIITYSPWLYIYNDSEEMQKLVSADIDPMLSYFGAVMRGMCFAGLEDEVRKCKTEEDAYALGEILKEKFSDGEGGYTRAYYYLNPGLADVSGLAPISCFYGTHELMLADVELFSATHDNVSTYKYEGMNHVFPVYPIPESEKVMKQVKTLIYGK